MHDAASQGYHAFLTKLENLKLLVFVADLLFVFSRYHKKIQSEYFNITDLPDWKSDVMRRLDDLQHSPVLGGWESELQQQYQPEDNLFMDIELKRVTESQRKEHHLYVSETTRNFVTVRSEVLESLKAFLTQRLSFDEDIQKLLKCFISFQAKDDDLVMVHQKIACDLQLSNISEEYRDAVRLLGSKSLSLLEKVEMLAQAQSDYGSLAVVFARIAACMPHSADVERLISLYNQLKTSDRSCLTNETVSHYLYVDLNMSVLAEFNPSPAVEYWWKQRSRRSVEPTKAKEQEWFLKTFSEASEKMKERMSKHKDRYNDNFKQLSSNKYLLCY
ncbi:Hypothetical predicted protein [Paramuricea clavata]|uniref:Uncharacterized protein n=1 Tax=Paramuricea clavata TaxID=317549 RepID=A0A7D9D9W3_PARCT|nr:Hypothetical predicted protein [Paramuricea clavata]